MKYYESTFEEYIRSVNNANIHPELESVWNACPKSIQKLRNIILYGPSGVGKYSQALKLISKYSTNNLKYDKRIPVITDKVEKKKPKQEVVHSAASSKGKSSTNTSNGVLSGGATSSPMALPGKPQGMCFRISEHHYEVDMSLLGCNSKTLWHDIFFQIIDIISLKREKVGIILCKNFHHIYNELLDIFYSYMRHPLHKYNIQLHFVLLTEHMGFIPTDIVQNCQCIPVKRPSLETYHNEISPIPSTVKEELDSSAIMNAKEIYHMKRMKVVEDSPSELFDIINSNILYLLENPEWIEIKTLRNHLYDLLVFNIDVTESFSFLICTSIESGLLSRPEDISAVIMRTFTFLKYFNNNYRPIYHLEHMFFFLLNHSHYSKYMIDDR
jgi:hypothetical protein